ncbi:MAG: DUF2851 family protein [Dehalococcoidia bacterium]
MSTPWHPPATLPTTLPAPLSTTRPAAPAGARPLQPTHSSHGVAREIAAAASGGVLEERALVALWLLGRVPDAALPLPVLRPGRAGRGPGPDVREATVRLPSGATRTGDVEMHLRATDFVRHGHASDPAYGGVILHVVWTDDRTHAERGGPTPHGGGEAVTVEIGPHLKHDVRRVEALVARGPSGAEPCAGLVARAGIDAAAAIIRREGQRRLAERAWRAGRLAAGSGWPEAWVLLLDRALRATAGRRREDAARHGTHLAVIDARLGADPIAALVALARPGRPGALSDSMRTPGMGPARAAEVAWNAALPLLIAVAAAYGDVELARATARLASDWPTPKAYGRTFALAHLAGPAPARTGALYAQGLLHVQDLWCTRGGCGACPLSASAAS